MLLSITLLLLPCHGWAGRMMDVGAAGAVRGAAVLAAARRAALSHQLLALRCCRPQQRRCLVAQEACQPQIRAGGAEACARARCVHVAVVGRVLSGEQQRG